MVPFCADGSSMNIIRYLVLTYHNQVAFVIAAAPMFNVGIIHEAPCFDQICKLRDRGRASLDPESGTVIWSRPCRIGSSQTTERIQLT
jgi:hypothetical protein